MQAVTGEHDLPVVSVSKAASDGIYPVEYTLRSPGRYRMVVTDSSGQVRNSRSSAVGLFLPNPSRS